VPAAKPNPTGYARAQGHYQQAGDLSSANIEKFDPSDWPKAAKGVGFAKASRGGLGYRNKVHVMSEDGRELTKVKIR